MLHRGKHGTDGHHMAIREAHFAATAKHEPTEHGNMFLRHPSDLHNPHSHLHNATRHLTNEEALKEKPIEAHLPHHSVDKPGA